MCGDRKIDFLTLFAFSSENWKRPAREVRLLTDLFINALETEARRLRDNNVALRVIGDTARFGEAVGQLIIKAEAMAPAQPRLVLTIAANYGGRWDVTQACRAIAQEVQAGRLDAQQVTESTVAGHLSLATRPDPDLFIRTGGEMRISNFLLWQLAYTELVFTDVLWPDFDRRCFEQALDAYGGRRRRFGRTGEQSQSASDA